MFKRLRQLEISLARKCQLLFGAAVVLIIAAALFVPWQRIEQLTAQIDSRTAEAIAEEAVTRHILSHAGVATQPATAPANGTTLPANPIDSSRAAQRSAAALAARLDLPSGATLPRIVALEAARRDRDVSDRGRFEMRALGQLSRNPDDAFQAAYYERNEGVSGYRYAKALHLTRRRCGQCHIPSDPEAAAAFLSSPEKLPPAPPGIMVPLQSGQAQFVGIVSVDISSRIGANELLLNRAFLLTAGLSAGFLAIITFYFITTRLILQPVRVLQETADKVSQGDLNIRADINTGDEFQQLSETFNRMLVNLKDGSDQLRAINKSLDLRLGQLAETNVALYESNRLKSEFLANVSHELRTPLNSILGFAELLKDAAPAEPDTKPARYLNNILQSGRNLLDLINDLLDLAKIEAGRMEIRSEPLSVADLFEGLTTIIKPLAEQRSVSIAADVAAGVPILRTDAGKLQQVLYNFLSNAIKFSPAGETIDLRATREDDGHVRISVVDRGPGIQPEMHDTIFEKFRQIDGTITRSHSGTGLGLAISKELTTLMNGTIGVESVPGQGATFWVILPLEIESGHADMRGRLVLS